MKLGPFTIAAFVSSSSTTTRINDNAAAGPRSTSSSSALSLLPANVPALPATYPAMELVITNKDALSVKAASFQHSTSLLSDAIADFVSENILVPPANAADAVAEPPTKDEVKLLREAFSTFYGVDRDLEKSEQLLSQVIDAWQRQPPDEKAGLYRVRGDCYMLLLQPTKAAQDYGAAIQMLQGPGGEKADETELPAALLGRARAIRSMGTKATKEQAKTAASDYQLSLRLSSREDWDTAEELEEDGAMRNPYAAWEWGQAERLSGNYKAAVRAHTYAADFFDDIGDKARSVMSLIDVGIDQAADGNIEAAKSTLRTAISSTKKVEGRDIALLQRVIAKEGEGRIALASLLWDSGNKLDAETEYGKACERLDQLEANAIQRQKSGSGNLIKEPPRLKFNIDEGIGALDVDCSRFKNQEFLNDRLEWPQSLQDKVGKLNKLR